jgi:hypothetical protein
MRCWTLVFGNKKLDEQFVIEKDQVDLSKAIYSEELSSIAIDPEAQNFQLTWDRISFRRPLELISTVLESQGFANNFENLLSCLDSMIVGVRVGLPEKTSAEGPKQAKSFLPSLSFQLPSKAKVGIILKKFYAEIESYEAELRTLREKQPSSKIKLERNQEILERENERLKAQTAELKQRVELLTGELSHAQRSQAHTAKALETGNIIPPQLKIAVVRELSLTERMLYLRVGRHNFAVPMTMLMALPKLGDSCLLQIINDEIVDVFFHESKGQPFERDLATVLYVDKNACKLRDSRRRILSWQAQNEWETQQLKQLRRGFKLITYSVNGILLRFSLVRDPKADHLQQLVQEEITIYQIEQEKIRLAASKQPKPRGES